MKAKFKTSDFSEMLNTIRGAVPSDTDLAFVQQGHPTISLQIDGNSVMRAEAHNFEQSIYSSAYQVESDQTCEIGIPSSWITAAITKAPSDTCFLSLISDNEIEFKSGRFRTTSQYFPYHNPRTGKLDLGGAVFNCDEFDTKQLISILQFVSAFMAKEDVRYYLNGIAIDLRDGKMNFVSTNGHMLGLHRYDGEIDIDSNLNCTHIIFERSISEVVKFLKSNAGETTKFIYDDYGFELHGKGGSRFFGMFVNGKYPDWRRVYEPLLVKDGLTLLTDRLVMLGAIDRVYSVANKKNFTTIDFLAIEGALKISLSSDEMRKATEEIDFQFDGEEGEVDVTFRADYIHKVMNVFPAQYIKVGYSAPDEAIYIHSANADGCAAVLTPVRR